MEVCRKITPAYRQVGNAFPLFKENVGKILDSDLLRKVVGTSEWARRIRELRAEKQDCMVGHIIDKSMGGTNEPNNLRAICSVCNEGASNLTLIGSKNFDDL